jgi:hypothetical protein
MYYIFNITAKIVLVINFDVYFVFINTG